MRDPARKISAPLPEGKFDYISNLAQGQKEALQKEIAKKFGLIGKQERREGDVLLLTLRRPNAPGLKPGTYSSKRARTFGRGTYSFENDPISNLAVHLEKYFEIPVIDRTELTERYDINLKWNEPDYRHPNPDGLKQALLDQLGVELVPSREPVEMLVVEKVK